MATQVFWIGQDGNVWLKTADGTRNVGKPINVTDNGFDSELFSAEAVQIDDPVALASYNNGGGEVDSDAAKKAQEDAERAALRGEIAGKADDVESAYGGLFGDLNNLIIARDKELEGQYGEQFKKAGDQYADAIPQIETSYASIGAGDSTDNTYAKVGAKKGFDDTTKTIGKNKESDKAKLGQYKKEQEAKFTADRDSARTNINRAGSTTEVDALRSMRNDLEGNLSTAGVTRATLGTDGSAKKAVTDLTKDGGRFEAAVGALDSIIKSSMSGAVKQAAVKAITDNAGLSDEEKQKIDQQYGNVYAEQQAL